MPRRSTPSLVWKRLSSIDMIACFMTSAICVSLSRIRFCLPVMKHAIISIEDKRFYTNDGVDLRGIGRALYQDVLAQKAVQGGSTIAQQFVKNSLAAQDLSLIHI